MLVKRPLLIGDSFVLVGFKEADWEKAAGTGKGKNQE
jgi:arsenate reductase-like glutaredoxin family protein